MSMIKKKAGIAFAVMLLNCPNAMAQSLEDAVAEVLATNPKINAAFSQFKASSYAHREARSGYFPTVDLNAGIGYENTNTAIIDDESLTRSELGISVRQLLFDGFATSGEVGRTKNEAMGEQYSLFSDAENLALEVVKVYLDVRKNEQILELSERNREVHQKIFYDIDKRSAAGLGSTADLSQITGRLARADSNLLAAKNNLIDAQTEFLRVVNQLPKDLVDPIADADMIPADLDAALALAVEQHPELKLAEFDIIAAEQEHDASQAGYYPAVHLELGANKNKNIDGIEGKNDDLSAMIRLRYNLFQGGRDLAKDKQSTYRINIAKETKRDTVRQVKEGTRLSWTAREILAKQVTFLQQHVEQSYDTVKAYKKQFNLGKRTLLDLLNTENELFEARKSYVAAQYDELQAQYRILNSTGQLLDSLRVARPKEWQEL